MKSLSVKQMRDMLVNAFEGGSNYWYMIEDQVLPEAVSIKDFCKGGKYQPKDDYYHWSQLVPTTKGCGLLINSRGDHGGNVVLNLQALRLGAKVMETKYPKQYAAILAEEDDSETGDVFLQCCVYGDLIFG